MNINYIIELKTDRLIGSKVIRIKSKKASRQGNQWQLSEWQQLTALNFSILCFLFQNIFREKCLTLNFLSVV